MFIGNSWESYWRLVQIVKYSVYSRLHKIATNDVSTILGSTREIMYGENGEHDRMHNIEYVIELMTNMDSRLSNI